MLVLLSMFGIIVRFFSVFVSCGFSFCVCFFLEGDLFYRLLLVNDLLDYLGY